MMQKYHGVCQDKDGNIVPGASVSIKNYLTAALAPIFNDDETTAKTNPIICDSIGQYEFKAAAGLYSIVATFGAYTSTIEPVTLIDDPSLVYLINNTGSTLSYGKACYINGSGTVGLAESGSTDAKASAVGVCLESSLSNGSSGRFRTIGQTARSGTPGDIIYLSSTPGSVTTTPPTTGWSTILGVQTTSEVYYLDPGLPVQM